MSARCWLVSKGVRAGVPSVTVPFLGDQPFWGRRLEQLGVAPPALPRARLGAAQLWAAIHIAATDTAMRRRAVDLGSRVRAEDGTDRAVRIIEGLLKERTGSWVASLSGARLAGVAPS